MPKPLLCPQCGAPITPETSQCPYCRTYLAPTASFKAIRKEDLPQNKAAAQQLTPPPSGGQAGQPAAARGAQFESYFTEPAPPEAPPAPEPMAIPPGWLDYTNEWAGFRVAYPPQWRVLCSQGVVSVRQDPPGLIAASFQPANLPGPLPASQAAQMWLGQASRLLTGMKAWVAPGATVSQAAMRVQFQFLGQQLTGSFLVAVNGTTAMVSGFICPPQQTAALMPTFQSILASFRPLPAMPRQPYQDPTESAFQIWGPTGWFGRLGVNRNNPGGTAMLNYSIQRDQAGTVAAVGPSFFWTFQEGNPWFSMPTGMPNLSYQPAPVFCQKYLPQWMSKFNQGLHIETIEDRPDLAYATGFEYAKAGTDPRTVDITAATLTTTYTEGGQRLKQVAMAVVTRQKQAASFFTGSSGLWFAFLNSYYRAPEVEFAALEPVLFGILDSFKENPAWQQNEFQRNHAIIAAKQQDIHNRQLQIGQTLSSISDDMMQSYENRQNSMDHISHQWSNAMLGYQDMTDGAGTTYQVPSGFDQYWRGNLDTIYGGSLLTNPDPTWTPLTPTGE